MTFWLMIDSPLFFSFLAPIALFSAMEARRERETFPVFALFLSRNREYGIGILLFSIFYKTVEIFL